MRLLFIAYVMVQYNYPLFTYKFVNALIKMIQESM